MSVQLTAQAVAHIQNALQHRGRGVGIALRLKKAGCSGWSYHLEFVDVPDQSDQRYEVEGVQIFVNQQLLPYIAGITLDYVKKGLEEGFTFTNPKAKGQCRCGKSFSA